MTLEQMRDEQQDGLFEGGEMSSMLVEDDENQCVHELGPIVEVGEDAAQQRVDESDDDGKAVSSDERERQTMDLMNESLDENDDEGGEGGDHEGASKQRTNVYQHDMGALVATVSGALNVTTPAPIVSSFSPSITNMPVLAAKRTTILVVEDCIATNGLHASYEPARFSRRRSLNGVESVLSSSLGKRCGNELFLGGSSYIPAVKDQHAGNEQKAGGGSHTDRVEEVLTVAPSSAAGGGKFGWEVASKRAIASNGIFSPYSLSITSSLLFVPCPDVYRCFICFFFY